MLLVSASIALLLGVQTPDTRPSAQDASLTGESVAKLLDKTHRKDRKSNKVTITGFQARLLVTTLGRAKDNITLNLETWFQQKVKYKTRRGDRARDMSRFKVIEQGKVMQQGQDATGQWLKTGKSAAVKDLGGKNDAADRAIVRKYGRISRQLLAFLDPAAVVRRMKRTAVRDHKLGVGRGKKVDCQVVTGNLEAFPFYSFALDKDAPPTARVQFFVSKKTGLLRSVRATAMVKTEAGSRAFTEIVDLSEYKNQNGVMLPSVLRISRFLGRREPLVKIEIMGVRLNPKLTATDFKRPR